MSKTLIADSSNIDATLRSRFGFEAFRPGQAEAIRALLGGLHALVVMPTGAGKSLIYQLAALHFPGVTVVISPLIALMKDQVDVLNGRDIAATCIHSGLAPREQDGRLQALAEEAYRLVYVAPERLRSVRFRRALRSLKVSLLAVDEAHCISEWGHDFRPDYLHIAAARGEMGNPVTVALTATATPEVQDDIVRLLRLPSAQRFVTGFNRPNLSFHVRYVPGVEAKLAALRDLLKDLGDGRALVYVGTRRDAEEVAEFLRAVVGIEARHYHGGLAPDARTEVQEAFLGGSLPVVAATNAFGMGIDRADIRLVVHYAVPGRLEAYYQEAGRAGRDGLPARAVLLYDPSDRGLQEWLIDSDVSESQGLRRLYDAVCALGDEETWTSFEMLSSETGLSEVQVRVGLARLEATAAVEHLGDDGSRLLVRGGLWNEGSIRAAVAAAQRRREHRLAQLNKMIAYAESDGCRRRILLEHFGEKTDASVDACCDNCMARAERPAQPRALAALSNEERIALAILDAVRLLKWDVGRKKLAQILKGSGASEMHRFGYDRHKYYGRLKGLRTAQIESLIDQCIEQGYIKVIGDYRPLVRLTPKGTVALETRASIALRFRTSRTR